MMRIFRTAVRVGLATPQSQDIRRTMTGPADYVDSVRQHHRVGEAGVGALADLEHLYKRYAQVEVREVAAHEAAAIDNADGDDRSHVLLPRHVNALAAIEKSGGSSEDLRSDCGKNHVPGS